jgi:hypothetical protein
LAGIRWDSEVRLLQRSVGVAFSQRTLFILAGFAVRITMKAPPNLLA